MENPTQVKIWRDMDLTRFLSLLSNEALYFACPCELEDPYEGFYPKSLTLALSRFPQQYLDQFLATRDELVAKYPQINLDGLNAAVHSAGESFRRSIDETRLKFGVTCWHKSEVESEAMWKLYSALGCGIAVESTEQQLRDSILNEKTLIIDDVKYVDFENGQIEKGHKHYGLFLKRKSFEHEKELRGTILLKQAGKGVLVKCNLDKLITQIHISPFAPNYFREAVENICAGKLHQLSTTVVQSSLFQKPGDDYRLNLRIERSAAS